MIAEYLNLNNLYHKQKLQTIIKNNSNHNRMTNLIDQANNFQKTINYKSIIIITKFLMMMSKRKKMTIYLMMTMEKKNKMNNLTKIKDKQPIIKNNLTIINRMLTIINNTLSIIN